MLTRIAAPPCPSPCHLHHRCRTRHHRHRQRRCFHPPCRLQLHRPRPRHRRHRRHRGHRFPSHLQCRPPGHRHTGASSRRRSFAPRRSRATCRSGTTCCRAHLTHHTRAGCNTARSKVPWLAAAHAQSPTAPEAAPAQCRPLRPNGKTLAASVTTERAVACAGALHPLVAEPSSVDDPLAGTMARSCSRTSTRSSRPPSTCSRPTAASRPDEG